jgi:hypothetical protein
MGGIMKGSVKLAAVVVAVALTPLVAIAQDQAAEPDPAFEAAKQAFEALPLDARIQTQRNLVWAVPFNGAALGSFGNLTFKGIKAFETKNGSSIDGILDDGEREALGARAADVQKGVRFAVIEDKKSGIRIGIPAQILPKRSETPLGAKFQNTDNSASLETAIGKGSAADLQAAFERFMALPDRKVTYKLLRPDFFVITGTKGSDSFYIRYAANAEAMRGFTFRYPTAKQKVFDRFVIAAANTFEPFPGAAPVDPITNPIEPITTNEPTKAKEPAAPKERRTTALQLANAGLVSPVAALEGCRSLTIGGKTVDLAGSVNENRIGTLEGFSVPQGLAIRGAAPQDGEPVLAVGFGLDGSVQVAPGTLKLGSGLSIQAALQPGGQGAAVLDKQGQLIGIVTGDPTKTKPIGGVTPVTSYGVAAFDPPTPGADTANGIRSAGEIATMVKEAGAQLVCSL